MCVINCNHWFFQQAAQSPKTWQGRQNKWCAVLFPCYFDKFSFDFQEVCSTICMARQGPEQTLLVFVHECGGSGCALVCNPEASWFDSLLRLQDSGVWMVNEPQCECNGCDVLKFSAHSPFLAIFVPLQWDGMISTGSNFCFLGKRCHLIVSTWSAKLHD